MARTISSVVEVADLPDNFSFSRFLVGTEQEKGCCIGDTVIVCDGQPLDVVYSIALALNEEGRDLRQGSFYHLPLRRNIDFGHPCDIVFVDEEWNEFDCKTWDEMSWEQRIDLCAADGKIHGSERVIPICARVLAAGRAVKGPHPTELAKEVSFGTESDCHPSVFSKAACEHRSIGSGVSQTSDVTFRSTMSTDPATKFNNLAYSRPIEDVSTMLILFDSIGSLPLVCRTAAAEHRSLCRRFPTPGDVSETFIQTKLREDIVDQEGRPQFSKTAFRAAELVLLGSNRRSVLAIVCILLDAWKSTGVSAQQDLMHFGALHYLWSEIENKINTDREIRDIENMDFWPKSYPLIIEE